MGSSKYSACRAPHRVSTLLAAASLDSRHDAAGHSWRARGSSAARWPALNTSASTCVMPARTRQNRHAIKTHAACTTLVKHWSFQGTLLKSMGEVLTL